MAGKVKCRGEIVYARAMANGVANVGYSVMWQFLIRKHLDLPRGGPPRKYVDRHVDIMYASTRRHFCLPVAIVDRSYVSKEKKNRRVSDSVESCLSLPTLSGYRVSSWPPLNFAHAIGVRVCIDKCNFTCVAREEKKRGSLLFFLLVFSFVSLSLLLSFTQPFLFYKLTTIRYILCIFSLCNLYAFARERIRVSVYSETTNSIDS